MFGIASCLRAGALLLLFAALLALAAVPAQAAERGSGEASGASSGASTASTLILIEENDFFAGTDEHYTNGIKLSWVSGDLLK
jgi:hypothetical protein